MDCAYTMFGIDESYIKKINEVIEKCEDCLKAFDYHYSKHNSFQNEARNYLHYNIELDRIGDFLMYACTNVVVDALEGIKGLSVEDDDRGNIFINGKEFVSGCTAEDFEKKFTIKLNDSDAKTFCRDSFSYKELFFILDVASLHHISYDKYLTCAFQDFVCDVDCSQNSEDLYDAFDYFMHKVDEAERGKVLYDNSDYGEVSFAQICEYVDDITEGFKNIPTLYKDEYSDYADKVRETLHDKLVTENSKNVTKNMTVER